MTQHVRFAFKISDQIAAWEAAGHSRKDFQVDPGKFGRLAATKPLAARWAACRTMNEIIRQHGVLTCSDVVLAFEQAGLK